MKMMDYFQILINHAIEIKANDIYIFPNSENFAIKMHSNLEIIDYEILKNDFADKLFNYCKYISSMSISEKRRPQLGSYLYQHNNINYYLRFSSVGNFDNKESMVIRIIYSINDQSIKYIDNNQLLSLEKNAHKGGMILFAGTTGSGKTTSVYKLANMLGRNKVVMSIEDPVEIVNESFLQLQVNDNAGMGYNELIKVGLRHRPDIFIIGEIRDNRTASAAIRAALSGHLVLSTIHANNAESVLNRIHQLDINLSDIEQSINTIVYQQLVKDNSYNNSASLTIIENPSKKMEKINDIF
ncbi:Flp pilus assembly complex ATPase component TadA [Apilactobacillus apisilvae]|uniref:Flp pilus assembly complex ATPase component TadA n=1 Tax=Apilactobacillus apisilvae TaxID=2923364 RepID=A0ABY4PHC0_9LACO|nr:competence type IV pilus ATPase ComGA [Apilactobacillus apisilvae]UQS85211.1 Flp pilus assembly complex ATPase component TadA [Apilactobacillus apisilvae]